jgi:hypothetical protein
MGVLAVALLPAGAMAHKRHGRHHRSHAARKHARRHGRRNGSDTTTSSSTTDTTSTTTTSTTTTTSSASQNTVGSYDATTGKLVVNMADGSTESGLVTKDTHLRCEPSNATTTTTSTTTYTSTSNTVSGSGVRPHDQSSGDSGDDSGDGGDDQGDDGEGHCTTNDLAGGRAVLSAVLAVTDQGAVWMEVKLG